MSLNTLYSIGSGAVIGAIGAKAGGIIAEKLDPINPFKLVSKMIPQAAKDLVKTKFAETIGLCNAKIGELLGGKNNPSLCKRISSIIGAPIVEEVVFRALIQELLKLSLSYGMPEEAAQVTSIFLANILFSIAHGRDLESIAGTELWLKGASYSAAYIKGGLLGSILAHVMNNARQYMPSLSELFSKEESSGFKDFSEIVAMNRQIAAAKASKDAQEQPTEKPSTT